MRKPSVKTLLRQTLSLWSLCVRTRDKFRCQWCGRRGGKYKLDAHHIIPRSRCGFAGRFDLDNGVTLCYRCHKFEKNNKEVEYARWLEFWLKNRGEKGWDGYDNLNLKYKGAIVKPNRDWVEFKKKVLLEILEELCRSKTRKEKTG